MGNDPNPGVGNCIHEAPGLLPSVKREERMDGRDREVEQVENRIRKIEVPVSIDIELRSLKYLDVWVQWPDRLDGLTLLFDAILIKDNHIRLAGGVQEAVSRMRVAKHELPIEVEAQSLEQVDAALAAGAHMILLDNLPVEQIREAVRRVAGRAKIEISGGVTLARMRELAETGADYVSVGALTHSAPAADVSFELEPDV